MDWSILLVDLLAFLLYWALFFAVIVARSGGYALARRSFRLYLLTMLLWSLAAFLLNSGLDDVSLWFRIVIVASLGSALALLEFVKTVLDRRWRWAPWIYAYGGVVMLAALVPNLVVRGVSVHEGVLTYGFTPLLIFVAGPGYGLNLFCLAQLLGGSRASEDPLLRNRLRYLAIGMTVLILTSLTDFTPLGKYPIDIAGSGLNALLIAYAILRHQLLDVKVVIRRSLLYSIPTVLVGAGYFLIISLALKLFPLSQGISVFLLSLLVAIVAALLAQPLRSMAQGWIDRLFFREKYDSGRMLERLSSKVASVLDLDLVTHSILEEITATLHIRKAAFLLKRGGRGEYYLAAQKGIDPGLNMRFSETHPIVVWLSSHAEILSRREIEVNPQFRGMWGREREELEKVDAELFIPLKAKGELVGIFAVGSKQSEERYSPDDQQTLVTLANQTAVAIENARLFDAETRQRREAETLHSALADLTSAIDIQKVLDSTLVHLNVLVPYDAVCLMILHEGLLQPMAARGIASRVELIDQVGIVHEPAMRGKYGDPKNNHLYAPETSLSPSAMAAELDGISFPVTSSPTVERMVNSGRPLVIPDTFNETGQLKRTVSRYRSWIGAPILVQGEILACLSLSKVEAGFYQQEDADLLAVFAGQVGLALQNARLFEAIQQLAMTDELTGISNRRFLMESGRREVNRAQRFARPFSILFMDIDHFKDVNDRYGHAVGDQVLRDLAEYCQRNLREVDIFAKYGGEEFVVLLPETDTSEAVLIAERLREKIKSEPIATSAGSLSITVSFGVASYHSALHDFDTLLDQADNAMYAAKQAGRDRVCIFESN
jgi:diguanylate cyclase (GGDEF)-like protein